ncbi:MAG: FAD:protein FMN transferase [Candidatus Thiodiazotropha sp. (ex Lucinoma borealis)]|nr:FAD:protein FMN transferase [Candidatus Thiodiazotropha sp. (ex Lucinoma borealis)]
MHRFRTQRWNPGKLVSYYTVRTEIVVTPSEGPQSKSQFNNQHSPPTLKSADGYWKGYFQAMASPCDIFMEVDDRSVAKKLLQVAVDEAWRIEQKFSRYRQGNIVHQLNNNNGQPVKVDDEVAHLLDFAQQCWELSEGMFDITSGVLRRVWRFDGGSDIPEQAAVEAILPLVGWQHVNWSRPFFTLPEGMEIDFGGIGKEYAVDRTLLLLQQMTKEGVLVNFGGDIHANSRTKDTKHWSVGIENPNQLDAAAGVLTIRKGALATSGDARRFLQRDGIRYGHVLNPKTGWPIEHAPRSVTVAANTCTEAGVLATFALLHGVDAEAFLKSQGVSYWLNH